MLVSYINLFDVKLPVVIRNEQGYIPLYFLQRKILSKISKYKHLIKSKMSSIYLSEEEVAALANFLSMDIQHDYQTFIQNKIAINKNELITYINEFKKIAGFEDTIFEDSVIDLEDMSSLNENCITGGWFQINNSIVPCIFRDNNPLFPYAVLLFSSKIIFDDSLTLTKMTLQEAEFLTNHCLKENLKFSFVEFNELITMTDILKCLNLHYIQTLPSENPFKSIVFIEFDSFDNISNSDTLTNVSESCPIIHNSLINDSNISIPYNSSKILPPNNGDDKFINDTISNSNMKPEKIQSSSNNANQIFENYKDSENITNDNSRLISKTNTSKTRSNPHKNIKKIKSKEKSSKFTKKRNISNQISLEKDNQNRNLDFCISSGNPDKLIEKCNNITDCVIKQMRLQNDMQNPNLDLSISSELINPRNDHISHHNNMASISNDTSKANCRENKSFSLPKVIDLLNKNSLDNNSNTFINQSLNLKDTNNEAYFSKLDIYNGIRMKILKKSFLDNIPLNSSSYSNSENLINNKSKNKKRKRKNAKTEIINSVNVSDSFSSHSLSISQSTKPNNDIFKCSNNFNIKNQSTEQNNIKCATNILEYLLLNYQHFSPYKPSHHLPNQSFIQNNSMVSQTNNISAIFGSQYAENSNAEKLYITNYGFPNPVTTLPVSSNLPYSFSVQNKCQLNSTSTINSLNLNQFNINIQEPDIIYNKHQNELNYNYINKLKQLSEKICLDSPNNAKGNHNASHFSDENNSYPCKSISNNCTNNSSNAISKNELDITNIIKVDKPMKVSLRISSNITEVVEIV